MRLIDADKLMERLEEEQRIHVGHAAYQGGLAGAGILIAEAPTAKSEGWISTSERQPDGEGIYLAWLDNGKYGGEYMILGYHDYGKGLIWDFNDPDYYGEEATNVTHWMPLPEPPEVEE